MRPVILLVSLLTVCVPCLAQSAAPAGPTSPAASAPVTEADRINQAIVTHANDLSGAMVQKGLVPPDLAKRVVTQLMLPIIQPDKLPLAIRKVYWRTISYAAPTTGDLKLALLAGQNWQRLVPDDRMARRNMLFLHWLAGDREQVTKDIAILNGPQNADWQGWLKYMAHFTPLVADKPKARLMLSDGNQLDLASLAGKVVVLDFWTAGTGGGKSLQRQMDLLKTYAGKPVEVIGVNLDAAKDLPAAKQLATLAKSTVRQSYRADQPEFAIAPKPFDVTGVPTACVIGLDGTVLFAGDPGPWEMHIAIAYGLIRPSTPTTAPAGPQTQPGQQGPPPSSKDEQEARKLYDQAFDYMRISRKTFNTAMRNQAMQKYRECAAKYPNTKAGKEALQELANSPAPAPAETVEDMLRE